MDKLFVWLASAVGPLAKKVLVALGIGWLSYTGVQVALDAARSQVVSSWGQIPADIANIVGLFGFSQAAGIILGAISARAGLLVVQRLGKVAS